MQIDKFIKVLMELADEGEDIGVEFPSLCGTCDAGRKNPKNAGCKEHGHLPLAVTPDTVRKTALSYQNSHNMMLITYPANIKEKVETRLAEGGG